ncbi:putative membrane protein [Parabacteroides sp. PFB2-10]|uniref:glycerophosphoryl diester phosphodiesterase membrane domain-containing protein n=1 Tax=Parabacteroides sp. PFB2-10 TaxID=1742405 RepID=UPI0024752054|nr:glycerophosphoryl diester phosphodiesterase membrane domain-containing protein [Parabacteroides sp. PFB2-10]MDH6313520.1 putative membrane protein [Parabacteroides sp. PFB2-10]
MKPTFTISEVFSTSWKCLKQNIWILVGLLVGYMIIAGILNMFMTPTELTIGTVVVSLISIILQLIFQLGYIKNLFQALDGIEPQFSAYGQQASKILNAFVASLIAGVAMLIGLVLFIIPGFYIGIRLSFFSCFIVEENAGPIEALKKSWELTKGQVLPLFVLLLVMIGIILIGVILLGIGVLVAAPLVALMSCYVFRKLNTPVAVLEEVVDDVIE